MPTYPAFFALPEPIEGGDQRKRAGASRLPAPAPSWESVSRRGGSALGDCRLTDLPGVRRGVGIREIAIRRVGRRRGLKGHHAARKRGSEYARIRLDGAENPCRCQVGRGIPVRHRDLYGPDGNRSVGGQICRELQRIRQGRGRAHRGAQSVQGRRASLGRDVDEPGRGDGRQNAENQDHHDELDQRKATRLFMHFVSLANLVTYNLNPTADTLYTTLTAAFHLEVNPSASSTNTNACAIPVRASVRSPQKNAILLPPIASKTKYKASPARPAFPSFACAPNPIPSARRPAPEIAGACFRPPGAQGARRDRERTPAPSWSHRNTSSLAAHRAAARGTRLGSPAGAPSATRPDWHAQAIRYFLLRPAGAWPPPAAAARFSPRRRYIPWPPFRRPPGKSATARIGARRTAR